MSLAGKKRRSKKIQKKNKEVTNSSPESNPPSPTKSSKKRDKKLQKPDHVHESKGRPGYIYWKSELFHTTILKWEYFSEYSDNRLYHYSSNIQIFTISCRIFTMIHTSLWIRDAFINLSCNPILDLSWWEPPLVKFIRPLVHVYGRLFSGLHGSFTSLVHSTMPGRAHLLCLTSKKAKKKTSKKSQKTTITTLKNNPSKPPKIQIKSLNPHQSIHSYYKQKKSLQILGWICKKSNRYLN